MTTSINETIYEASTTCTGISANFVIPAGCHNNYTYTIDCGNTTTTTTPTTPTTTTQQQHNHNEDDYNINNNINNITTAFHHFNLEQT